MTENELKKTIAIYKKTLEVTANNGETCFRKLDKDTLLFLEELEQYRAIGTVEEIKALKEKNTPMELAEHNFQDEPHHYLCPVCRNIVSHNQSYCEECGQALET